MKIGFFDSGIGGICVLHHAMQALPQADFVYYADSDHVPYGEKSNQAILAYTEQAMETLIGLHCDAVVIACNTAISIAIATLRQEYELPFIGMEPAVKPAVELAEDRRVMVIATPVTLRENKLRHLLGQVDAQHCVDLLPMPGLVRLAEKEIFDGPALEDYLRLQFAPYSPDRYEALVLGCTHFNYFADHLQSYFPHTTLIDGIGGTVRQLKNVLTQQNIAPGGSGQVLYYESGRPMTSSDALARFRRLHMRLDALEKSTPIHR